MSKSPSNVPQEELQGVLEKFIYTNEETHYTIAILDPEEGKAITIVGNLPSVQCGETLKLQGEWIEHPQFGRQFKIHRFESILPSSITGLKKYLGSGLISGIGEKFAEKIVDHFGKDTLEIIDQFSGRLKEVPGLGAARAAKIRQAWVEQKAVREIMIFLQSYGVTPSQASKIYKIYGDDSMAVVKENPYRLARDVYGIGFRIADQIARNLGIPSDSAKRIQAGIHYQLEQFLSEGHTCYPMELLARATAENLLGVEEGPVEHQIKHLIHDGHLVLESKNNMVFLAGIHRAECLTADRLRAITRTPISLPEIKVDKALEWTESESHIVMSDTQREAVRMGVTAKLTIITGGPGVGKTTIIRNIVKILSYKKARIALCAPTGRAAKRLSESCSYPAQTIHRLLRYDPTLHHFTFDQDQPLEVDMVVVDESSMLDITLAHHLLNAIPNTASIIFVGDIDQLPSVGPGNVLRDLIESRIGKVIRLSQIFRQHHTSQIVVNAHRVNEGRMPVNSADGNQLETSQNPAPLSDHGITTGSDFHVLHAETPEQAIQRIVKLCTKEIPQVFGFDPVNDIQVMAPMHRGVCGVENLNRELQKNLNPSRKETKFRLKNDQESSEIERYGRLYRTGDKVMQIKNNYDKEVFNGDLGRIVAVHRETSKMFVNMDGKEIEYDFTDLDELLPAYAISIHKSQGSEYPVVVIPILTQHYIMLQRNLIYTGITRGKKLVVLVGNVKALSLAVRNNKTAQRYGMLGERCSAIFE